MLLNHILDKNRKHFRIQLLIVSHNSQEIYAKQTLRTYDRGTPQKFCKNR